MSRTNYEAVADFAGHWLHRAQVSLLTGEIGQIKLSHIRKKTLVRAWCGLQKTEAAVAGLARKTEAAEPASLYKVHANVTVTLVRKLVRA